MVAHANRDASTTPAGVLSLNMSPDNRRLLIISRAYPPQAGVSVERVTKYSKYLPQFGWDPTVITGTKGVYGWGEDPLLAKDVEHVTIFRSTAPDLFGMYSRSKRFLRRSRPGEGRLTKWNYQPRGPWHPKSMLLPDSEVLWIGPAVASALRHARRLEWDAVYGHLLPASNAVIAYLIARQLNIPFFLDYRDPWTGYFISPRRLRPLARLELAIEDRVFSAATAVMALNPVCVEGPLQRSPGERPVTIITNGYDESDFEGRRPRDLPGFSIVHTGNLHEGRPLTDLWAVVRTAFDRRPELRGQLHVWQVGTVDDFVEEQLKNAPEGVHTHYVPPVPMCEAIEYMLGADLLLVLSSHTTRNTPAKIYQYMRANRPILTLYERGADLLRDETEDANESLACLRDDHEAAATFLIDLMTREARDPLPIGPRIEKYSRRELTRRFAEVLTTGTIEGSVEP